MTEITILVSRQEASPLEGAGSASYIILSPWVKRDREKMLERLRGVASNLNAQPATVKAVLIVTALVLVVLLSRVLAGLAVLVMFVSLIVLVIRLVRRRPLKGWGIAALASLASIVVFTGIANAVYGPPEQPNQEQATAPSETSIEEQKAREAAQEEEAPQSKAKEKITTEEQAKSEAAESERTPSLTPSSEESKEEDAQEEEDEADRVSYDASVTVTRIVDGDTVDISPAVDGKTRVRFIGVDTPETKKPGCEIQPYGAQASEFTESQLRGKEVGLEFDKDREDGDERLLAYVYLPDDSMFNETLLEEGYAQVYTVPPNEKYVNRLVEAQEEARGVGRGIWALPADQLSLLDDRGNGIGGSGCAQKTQPKAPPQPPPQPQEQPTPTPTPDVPSTSTPTEGGSYPPISKNSCPPNAPIKGNQSGIYHPPGSRSYNVTNPEECFVSPADAEAAGYRAPKR